jgi:hypothetical protein
VKYLRNEKVLKAFLSSLQIGFYTQAEKNAALYAAMLKGRKTKLLSKAEKESFINRLSSEKLKLKPAIICKGLLSSAIVHYQQQFLRMEC